MTIYSVGRTSFFENTRAREAVLIKFRIITALSPKTRGVYTATCARAIQGAQWYYIEYTAVRRQNGCTPIIMYSDPGTT